VRRCQQTGQITATLVAEGGQAPRDCEDDRQRTADGDCECATIPILWRGGDIVVDLTAMRQVTQTDTGRAVRRFAWAIAALSGVSQVVHDEDVCQGTVSQIPANFNPACSADNQ